MLYITKKFALNLECSLNTCGDWHTSALDWANMNLEESNNSIFKDYGIEKSNNVPEHDGEYNIANTLRAILDIIESGNIADAQGAKDDFICNDRYTDEFFKHVIMLKHLEHWELINKFMIKEYKMEWIHYLEEKLE